MKKLHIVAILLIILLPALTMGQEMPTKYVTFKGSIIPSPDAMNLMRLSAMDIKEFEQKMDICCDFIGADWVEGNLQYHKNIAGGVFLTIKGKNMYVMQYAPLEGNSGNLFAELQEELKQYYTGIETKTGGTVYEIQMKETIIRFVLGRNKSGEIVGVYFNVDN